MMHDVLLIGVVSLVTVAIRFLPFIIFRDKNDVPDIVRYLGRVLPSAVMGMLVVYCLKDVDIMTGDHGIPEIVSVLATAGTYMWKKDASVSVIAGTACYILISQLYTAV